MMEANAKINPKSGLPFEEERRIQLVDGVSDDLLSTFKIFLCGAQAMADIYKRKCEPQKKEE